MKWFSRLDGRRLPAEPPPFSRAFLSRMVRSRRPPGPSPFRRQPSVELRQIRTLPTSGGGPHSHGNIPHLASPAHIRGTQTCRKTQSATLPSSRSWSGSAAAVFRPRHSLLLQAASPREPLGYRCSSSAQARQPHLRLILQPLRSQDPSLPGKSDPVRPPSQDPPRVWPPALYPGCHPQLLAEASVP